MQSPTTAMTITALARRIFRQREYIRPLGRWGVDKNYEQQEHTSNWASADHCGVCHDHLTALAKPKNVRGRIYAPNQGTNEF